MKRTRYNEELPYQLGYGKQKRDLELCQIGFEDAEAIQTLVQKVNPTSEEFNNLEPEKQRDLTLAVFGELRTLLKPYINEMMAFGQAEIDEEWLAKYVPNEELGYVAGILCWGSPKKKGLELEGVKKDVPVSGQLLETSSGMTLTKEPTTN